MGHIRKILITGARGFVGSRMAEALSGEYELITPNHGELDVISAEDVERFIEETLPDAILHTAAISDTGYCEEHPDESYLANVVSVENLAKIAKFFNVPIDYFLEEK